MPLEMGPLRLREKAVSAEVVSLGFEMQLAPIRSPVWAPDSEVVARLLLPVVVRFRLASHGINAQAGLVVLESPPCPGASAWLIRKVSPKEFLAKDFPGLRRVVLAEVRSGSETAIEEVVSAPEVVLMVLAVVSPGASRP